MLTHYIIVIQFSHFFRREARQDPDTEPLPAAVRNWLTDIFTRVLREQIWNRVEFFKYVRRYNAITRNKVKNKEKGKGKGKGKRSKKGKGEDEDQSSSTSSDEN